MDFANTHITYEPHGAQVTQVRNVMHIVTVGQRFGSGSSTPPPTGFFGFISGFK